MCSHGVCVPTMRNNALWPSSASTSCCTPRSRTTSDHRKVHFPVRSVDSQVATRHIDTRPPVGAMFTASAPMEGVVVCSSWSVTTLHSAGQDPVPGRALLSPVHELTYVARQM